MNRWALELKPDGKGHEVDAAEACAARESPAIFVWVHLDGREQDTLQWLQLHGGMPITVIYALTAMETRPRSEAVAPVKMIVPFGPSPARATMRFATSRPFRKPLRQAISRS